MIRLVLITLLILFANIQKSIALSDTVPTYPSEQQLLSALKYIKFLERYQDSLYYCQQEVKIYEEKLVIRDSIISNKDKEIINYQSIVETYKEDLAIGKQVQESLMADNKTLVGKLIKQKILMIGIGIFALVFIIFK